MHLRKLHFLTFFGFLILADVYQTVMAFPDDVYYEKNTDYHHYASAHKHHNNHKPSHLDDYQSYGNGELTPGNCIIPSSWRGKWFQSGVPQPIIIDDKSIGDKGTCIESSGDKFHFVVKSTNCHSCVVINKRHENVLEYKETSYCVSQDLLENLCSQIQGDAQLISLFRIDANPIDCPFKGAFTFTYNRGHGDCKYPVSNVDTCTEPSRLLLRYQACPDVLKTESTVEELQCLALWKDSSYHYLVGKVDYELASSSNEDRFRCFMFDRDRTGPNTIYRIAQSGDATCIGISSSTEGARTLIFTKIHEAGTKCKFPEWLSSKHWHSLDGKMNVRTHHKETTIHITDEARRNSSSGHYHHSAIHGNTYISSHHHPFFSGGTRIVCQTSKNITEDHVAIIAHHTEGCKSTTVCMHLYKRDNHVIELQIKRQEAGHHEDMDCGREDAMGATPYVTLISTAVKSGRCPYLGKFMATGVTQDGRLVADLCGTSVSPHGAFHSLVVGCGNRATIEFHSRCVSQEPITSYECHGSWEENGTGFLIASPLSRSSTSARRYCFMYAESEEGFRVFSSSESCHRDGSPSGDGLWAFNLTIDGQCAEPVTGGVSRTIFCDVCWCVAIISVLVLVALVHYLMSDSSEDFFLHAKILPSSENEFHSYELQPSILNLRGSVNN